MNKSSQICTILSMRLWLRLWSLILYSKISMGKETYNTLLTWLHQVILLQMLIRLIIIKIKKELYHGVCKEFFSDLGKVGAVTYNQHMCYIVLLLLWVVIWGKLRQTKFQVYLTRSYISPINHFCCDICC